MKRILPFIASLAVITCSSKGVTVPTPSFTVAFGGGQVTSEIASTSAERTTGLMGRASLGADAGMLFVFQDDQVAAVSPFWMHGTPVAVSIAFLDANKVVINIDDMAPNTDTYHYAAQQYRYALEVNQGWFASHGVVAGSTATFTLPAGTIVSP